MNISIEERLESVLNGEIQDINPYTRNILKTVIAHTGSLKFLRWANSIDFLAITNVEKTLSTLKLFHRQGERVALFTKNHSIFIPSINKGIHKHNGDIFKYITKNGVTKWVKDAPDWTVYISKVDNHDLNNIFLNNNDTHFDYDWFVCDFMTSMMLDLGYYVYSTVIVPHQMQQEEPVYA